jgi:hypothetical protein
MDSPQSAWEKEVALHCFHYANVLAVRVLRRRKPRWDTIFEIRTDTGVACISVHEETRVYGSWGTIMSMVDACWRVATRGNNDSFDTYVYETGTPGEIIEYQRPAPITTSNFEGIVADD